MNRILISVLIAATAIAPGAAFADDPQPTKEQLDAAKQAFAEGKQLHDQGKLAEAAEKFKESYKLSRNPVLLYNIGLTLDENTQKDLALFYYRKFLSDAPQDAKQRKAATDRVAALEKEKLEADLNGTTKPPDTTGTPVKPPDTTVKPPDTTVKAPVKIKPAGTYTASDFQHQIVDEAPPQKPLDITAFVPEDSGFTVTLYFRGAGDSTFTSKLMKWRYKELVGRIPGKKMAGISIQYYLEAKDQAGNVIARSGKSVSPNLVNLEAGATPRFYPDLTDEGDAVSPSVIKHHDDEDPLHPTAQHEEEQKPIEVQPETPSVPGEGFTDVGSQKFKYAKWGATGTAGVFLGLSMTFYILAGVQANHLSDDVAFGCMTGQKPPCHAFDAHDQAIQDAGKRNQTISNTTLAFGLIAGAVAGYYWYRELSAKKHGELKLTTKASSPETTWVVVPAIGDGFGGAAAAVRF